jgi:hypothetical protein
LAGILLDTENLDFASIRDTDMATALLVGSGSLGRNGFYKQCTNIPNPPVLNGVFSDVNNFPSICLQKIVNLLAPAAAAAASGNQNFMKNHAPLMTLIFSVLF